MDLKAYRANFKGDLSGAVSAAIISIPLSIGYGIIVYGPLGPEFLPFAALLGIFACLLGGICASLLGGTQIQITAPKAPLSLILAAFVLPLTMSLHVPEPASRNILIVGLASLCVLTGGIIQLLFGVLRLGNLIKYVPYPVVSGFMNGIAMILILEQLGPLVGARSHISLYDIFYTPTVVQPLTLLVGLTTIIVIFCARRLVKGVPASLVGLVAGTALFYTLEKITGAADLGTLHAVVDHNTVAGIADRGRAVVVGTDEVAVDLVVVGAGIVDLDTVVVGTDLAGYHIAFTGRAITADGVVVGTTADDDPALGRYRMLGSAEHHFFAAAIGHFCTFFSCHFYPPLANVVVEKTVNNLQPLIVLFTSLPNSYYTDYLRY